MKQQNKAYLFAATAVLMWSTIGSAFKLTLAHIQPVQMMLYATLISVIVLFIIIIFQKKTSVLWMGTRNDLWRSALNSLLNPFLYYIILLYAYDRLQAQEAMVLNYAWPVVLTLLASLMLSQKIGWKSLAAILISFFGIFIIATAGKPFTFRFSDPYGVGLALTSTIIWALFWIINVKDHRDEVIKLFWNFLFGFIYILILSLVLTVMGVAGGSIILPTAQAAIGIVYIGLFELSLAFFFWLRGLKLSATAAKVSNLIFISPVLSLVFIRLTVHEKIHPATVAGLVFILAGILLQRKLK
jgi:drug/metabolite transporter (DMT)-like permease